MDLFVAPPERLRGLALTLAFLLAAAGGAEATTFHVDAAKGDDKNPGDVAIAPLKTISRAARLAGPGDTVVVAPGIYDEMVRVGGHPKAAKRTVFLARLRGKAVLTGEPRPHRFSISRPRVSIVGFVCKNSTEHAIDVREGADGVGVDACVLVDNRLDGVFFRRCRDGRRRSRSIRSSSGSGASRATSLTRSPTGPRCLRSLGAELWVRGGISAIL